MIAPKKIVPGAEIKIVVNGVEHHHEIVEIKDGRVVLKRAPGTGRGRSPRWWLPYERVRKEGWLP